MNNFNELINSFKDLERDFNTLIAKRDLKLDNEFSEISDRLSNLVTLLDDPVISSPLDSFKITPLNKIDDLALGSAILSMKQSNCTNKDIADLLSIEVGDVISEKEINDWLDNYNSSPITEKPDYSKASVFDGKNRYEELYQSMVELLDIIKLADEDKYLRAKITKEQVQLEWAREMRQLIKAAKDLITKVELYDKVREFQKVVLEVINEKYPLAAMDIVKALKERKMLEAEVGFDGL